TLLTQKTYATQLLVTEDSRVWATGLASGLSFYSEVTDAFQTVRPKNWPHDEPFAKQVYTAMNAQNIFWLAGYQGILFRYDVETNTAKSFYAVDTQDPAYSITQIFSMTKDPSGRIWLSGTGGIGIFDPASEEFTHLGKLDNFNTQTYYSVQIDSDGFIWSTPTNSLIRIDPRTLNIIRFNRNNGMPIIEFSPASMVHTDGTIWTGGLNGLVKFNPRQLTLNQAVQAPQLNQFEVLETSADNASLSYWTEKQVPENLKIQLPLSESTLKISFGVLDFSLLNGLQYRYQLLGFDLACNSAEAGQPEASYTRLPHGDYHFLVSTSFDGMIWTDPTLIVQVKVLPNYWQSWWFKTLCLVLFTACIYCIFRARHNQQEKLRLRLEKEVERRTQQVTSLSNQRSRFYSFVSHELKTPLTLVQDPLARIINQTTCNTTENLNLISTAYRNAARLSELVDRLLKEAFEGDLNLNKSINMKNKVIECVNQLIEFADSRRVKISLDALETCYVDCLENDLESVIFNLLNNAVKYSRNKETITIRCKAVNNKIVFTVHNRITRALDLQRRELPKVSNGFGFPIIEQAISAIGGRFKFLHQSNEAVAIVTIPSHPRIEKTESSENKKTLSTLNKSDSSNREKPALLIVEDNKELRHYLMDVFRKNYCCIGSASAEEALEISIEQIPDIIVSDIVLPGKSGIELCSELKSRLETCHIPFLILTGKTDQGSIINGLKHQATDYLTKPVNTQEL
ncbi:MAG: response regulator, partial [Kangiellaceae bacterium]|nr:response regulator [Kangiellaceae bacterium]